MICKLKLGPCKFNRVYNFAFFWSYLLGYYPLILTQVMFVLKKSIVAIIHTMYLDFIHFSVYFIFSGSNSSSRARSDPTHQHRPTNPAQSQSHSAHQGSGGPPSATHAQQPLPVGMECESPATRVQAQFVQVA